MKILKYLFLLFILSLFGISVFIATQRSNIDLQKTIFIKLPRGVVFDYVNQYRNWELWASWKEDDVSMRFTYPENSAGQGSYMSCIGDEGYGKVTTTKVVQNSTIIMKAEFNGNPLDADLTFKDSVGGTKVVWKIKGEVNFLTKVTASFSGGFKSLIGNVFERSLNNLSVVLTNEISKFNISKSGLVTIPARYYVKSTLICKPSEMQAKIGATLPKIEFFFKNNNVKMNGKPFVIKEFENGDTLKLGVYGPMKEEIFMSANSDLTTGYMEGFTALKIILKGDYSHIAAAKAKALTEFNLRALRPSETILPMEVYFTTVSQNNKPSKWITFIQMPIYNKPISTKKIYRPKLINTKSAEAKTTSPVDAVPENEEF